MAQKRIEYIDAMRGFTMILVIYSHVCMFCFGDYFMAFNKVLFLLRLPCFFFISGWLFYKIGRLWDTSTVRQIISHKFMVQIIPTVIFLALHERTQFFHQLGAFKGGYWFTFALFVYFVLFTLTAWLVKKYCTVVLLISAFIISVTAYWYDASYHRIAHQLGWGRELLGFMGFVTWRYYLFFVLGAMAKKYFDRFLMLTDRHEVQSAVVGTFCLMAVLPVTDNWSWAYIRFGLSGICGMVMVFTFFRYFASWFSKKRVLGRCLQYVGTRTLDIYLLHFFFLPEFLLSYHRQLLVYDNRLLEVTVVMGEALVVLACCLVTSYILRLSPFLAKYLFGVQNKEQHSLS